MPYYGMKSKLKKLDIGSVTWKLEYKTEKEDPYLEGKLAYTDTAKLKIVFDSEAPQELFGSTLLHEIYHVCLHLNPNILKYITPGDSDEIEEVLAEFFGGFCFDTLNRNKLLKVIK